MKVAFCIRPEYKEPLGGDAIQMLKTKEHLEKNFDVNIDVITNSDELSNEYDLAHVFNFSTYGISRKFIEKAVEIKIPIVSSSIYWDYSYASVTKLFNFLPFIYSINEPTIKVLKMISEGIGKIYKKPVGVSSKFKRNAKWMFNNSTLILPNSIEEGNLLLKWINEDNQDKIRVVYNAAENSNTQLIDNKEIFLKKYNIPDNYILQVGRIEFCKNQLNLVSALSDNPEIPIVFVGKIFDVSYYKKLKKIADKRGNVYFINGVPHSEINSFFRHAKVHVLLSLRESPGLVSIEALSNKCPIVISDEKFLPLNTYFSNQPYFVNPLNLSSIMRVVLKAYNERIIDFFDFDKFSWDNVSKQTHSAYTEAINKYKSSN